MQNKIITQLLKRAKTKEGEKVSVTKTVEDISALSLYYMADKNSWQVKMWLYPTNRSKTFNVSVTFEQVERLLPIINSIGLIDNLFEEEKIVENEKGWE